ncbi:MAG: site-specific integrase [Patescibacteria group bacterium]
MSVNKRGKKYWIDFRFNRQRYRHPSPDNSLAGAKAYEALLRQKLARGEPITEEKAKITTFAEFSRKWFDVYVKNNNKPSEIANKESALRIHLIPFFDKKEIDKISNLDIENYKAKEISTGLSNKSINNILIILNKCLGTAEEWGEIDKKPKVKLLKVQPQKFDFLTGEEAEALLKNSDGWLHEMILIALKTGLRFGELIALDWDDLDFTAKNIIVRRGVANGILGSTKSNKIRTIPMAGEIIELMMKRYQSKGLVFPPSHDSYLTHNLCHKELKRACRRAGLREIGWHTLRHSFASHLAQNGVSLKVIQELLGHSNIVTTMRYSHLTAASLIEAIKTLDGSKNGRTIELGHNMATIPTEQVKIPAISSINLS